MLNGGIVAEVELSWEGSFFFFKSSSFGKGKMIKMAFLLNQHESRFIVSN